MKRILSLTMLALLTVLVGCKKDEGPGKISLTTITKQTFDYTGGLGSAVVDAGGAAITAVSDQSDWCKVAVVGTSINFNISAYTGDQDRIANITVEAAGYTPLVIPITQTKFEGLIASPTSLTFSEKGETKFVLVTTSGDYTVTFVENPGNAFSYEKTETGVNFTCEMSPSFEDISGRATLTPATGEAVAITMLLSSGSVYENLLGTWTLTNNTAQYNNPYPNETTFTFTEKVKDQSYNVHIDVSDFGAGNVFTAEFEDGKVYIYNWQEMGTNQGEYLTLHFNGTSTEYPGQTIIFFSPEYGWVATPQFNSTTNTVTLSFADIGVGADQGHSIETMCLWRCANEYFNFTTPLGTVQDMVISKSL